MALPLKVTKTKTKTRTNCLKDQTSVSKRISNMIIGIFTLDMEAQVTVVALVALLSPVSPIALVTLVSLWPRWPLLHWFTCDGSDMPKCP